MNRVTSSSALFSTMKSVYCIKLSKDFADTINSLISTAVEEIVKLYLNLNTSHSSQ